MLLALFVCLLVSWLPLAEMFGPMKEPEFIAGAAQEAEKMKEEAEKIKEEADDENMTEEQFFRCFADINCNLGIEAKDELFKCWHLNTAEVRKVSKTF
ncbi:hypothetical protein CDAR_493961 [Caerostris darwini]|uniref:Uncharacterized protein n=1 Tax=Caerostris darwini TaxID=1538125 RepID=A0AAV4VT04_9ARAC|nr:hypothetical protein CDAR_493961 [Caerostris darwini]